MQVEQRRRRPWQLHLHAKTNSFDLRIRATKVFPASSKFFRFSIKLMLPSVLVKLKARPKTSIRWISTYRFLKSKSSQIFEKLCVRCGSKKSISARRTCSSFRVPWCTNKGLAFWSPLDLVWQRISEKNKNGMLILSSIVFPYLSSLFKNLVGRKMLKSLVVFVLVMFSCPILQYVLYNYCI